MEMKEGGTIQMKEADNTQADTQLKQGGLSQMKEGKVKKAGEISKRKRKLVKVSQYIAILW